MKPVLCLLLAGCASFPAVKPTPKGTLLEIANVPEGENCFSIEGEHVVRRELCAYRLRTTLDEVVGKALDRHLAGNNRYHARLELEGVSLKAAPDAPRVLQTRGVQYHFTLTTADGKQVVDLRRSFEEEVPRFHNGTSLPLPDEMVQSPELYHPPVLYQMFFEMVDQISQGIDAARLNV